MATKLHSLEFSTEHCNTMFETMKNERRELLKTLQGKENKEPYYLALIKKVAIQTITERIYDGTIYQALQVPEKVYNRSIQVYLMDPEKRKVYEDETEKIREKFGSKTSKSMTKEQVLSSQVRLE